MADSFDIDLFGAHTNELHSPYVAGASFSITVGSGSSSSQLGWTLSSSDPDVMAVTAPLSGGVASVVAGSAGQATLTVKDGNGNVLDSQLVSVAIPDQVSLYAQGLLLTGATDSAAQITQPSIVLGGQATFLVRYFSQGTELEGSTPLQTTGTSGFTVSTVTETFATAREFLQVTAPGVAGSGVVSLAVESIAAAQIPVTAVAPHAVTHVTLLPQSTDNPQTGDALVLYAHAVDQGSNDVFGASFNWSIDGQSQASQTAWLQGPADLFFYTFDGTVAETVSAAYDGFSPSAVIHAQGGSVGSTADVGCAVAGAPGSPASSTMAGLGLALAAALCARRRRQP